MHRAGLRAGRITFNTEKELRADQQAIDGGLDSALEASLRLALAVERHERFEIRRIDRPTKRSAGEGSHDSLRAWSFLSRVRRMANEDAAPCRSIAGTSRVERTADGGDAHTRQRTGTSGPRPQNFRVASLVALNETDP